MPIPIDQAGPPGDSDAPRPTGGPQTSDRFWHPAAAPQFPLGPAERQAALRSSRDKVSQVYTGPFDDGAGATWAEAVSSLRAAWEEHEERYPERERATPKTHADGSWSSGETRTLTSEQNTEASKACTEIQEEGELVIFPALQRIEAADPDRRLAGLEHMLKGADRLKEKIAERLRYQPDLMPRQAASVIPDAVRFTFEYSVSHYVEGTLGDVDRLKGEGYELLKLKNLWAKDQYKGINTQWRRLDTGLRFEVQFHTPESLGAKELTHKAYERLRDPLTSKAEEGALEDYQRQVNTPIQVPPDVLGIEDYPRRHVND